MLNELKIVFKKNLKIRQMGRYREFAFLFSGMLYFCHAALSNL